MAALLDPTVQAERLLGYAHKYNGHHLVDSFRQYDRGIGLEREIRPALPKDWSCVDEVEISRSLQVLRRLGKEGWIAKEPTLRQNLQG